MKFSYQYRLQDLLFGNDFQLEVAKLMSWWV